jgi:hypothetical protein
MAKINLWQTPEELLAETKALCEDSRREIEAARLLAANVQPSLNFPRLTPLVATKTPTENPSLPIPHESSLHSHATVLDLPSQLSRVDAMELEL